MEANEKMYGLSTCFFEGAEKLLEVWFGTDDGYGEPLLDELDDYQNISTIIRLGEDDEEEKMSSDSGEDDSIFYFKNPNKASAGDPLRAVDRKVNTADLRRIPREALEQFCQVVKVGASCLFG